VDCRRRKRKREKERWARPKQERGEERKGFPFLKMIQTHSFEFKFGEFKFN